VPAKRRKKLLDASTWQRDKGLMEVAKRAQQALGSAVFDDHNEFRTRFDAAMKAQGDKLGAPEKKAIYKAVSWRDEAAPPVIAKRSKLKAGDTSSPASTARTWRPWARIASWSSTSPTASCATPSRCR
jgi:type I restriction enzyme M protein